MTATTKSKQIRVYCCENCFDDSHVKRELQSRSTGVGQCDFCRSNSAKIVRAQDLGNFVLEGVNRAYSRVTSLEIPMSFPRPSALKDILIDSGLFSKRIRPSQRDALVQSLFANPVKPGESIEHASDYEYLPIGFPYDGDPENDNPYSMAWDMFKEFIKHGRRFIFLKEKQETWGEITAPPESEWLGTISSLFPLLEGTVPLGTSLWRARVTDERFSRNPTNNLKLIGPPPFRRAKNMRMNPAGISYLYVCSDLGTCLSEVRPEVGSTVIGGRFEVAKPLRIVDLARTPVAPQRSIFDSEYDWRQSLAASFMQGFCEDVSMPYKATDAEIDYIPTQILAEAVRNAGYDGLSFPSSQRKGGTNYTLFCGPEDADMPLGGTIECSRWVELREMIRIKVSAVEFLFDETQKRRHRCPKPCPIATPDSRVNF